VALAVQNAKLYLALTEADLRKDEFLAMLAHELRNPLAPIRNALQVFKLDGSAALATKARDIMERQIAHLVRLVDDLLDVSRIMRGKIELKRESLILQQVIERAAETAQPALDEHGHTLTVEMPAAQLVVYADPLRLAQVLANLLNNAAKY